MHPRGRWAGRVSKWEEKDDEDDQESTQIDKRPLGWVIGTTQRSGERYVKIGIDKGAKIA